MYVHAPAVVDHGNGARPELVDEVADGARLLGIERSVQNRVRAAGKAEILGTLPFPAIGLALSPDGRTLYALSGFGWSSLTVVDLQRAKLEPPAN